MSSGIDDREIFDAGNAPEVFDDAPLNLPDDRSPDDRAVSDAIDNLRREGPTTTSYRPPQQPQPRQPTQPQTDPAADISDRSNSGLLRALLDERDQKKDLKTRLQRFEEQESHRQRQEERKPLSERLFVDPDGTIRELREEIRQEILSPMQQEVMQLRVNQDFAFAEIRHGETFKHAWEAWYGQVGTGQDARTYFDVMNSPSPGEAMVQWYRQQQIRNEIGDDFEGFKARLVEEALGGRRAPPAPNGAGRGAADRPRDTTTGQFTSRPQAPRLPTATSRLSASGNGLPRDDDGDGSDAAIFASARPTRSFDRD